MWRTIIELCLAEYFFIYSPYLLNVAIVIYEG